MTNPFDLRDELNMPPDLLYRTKKRMVAIWLRPNECLSMHSKDIEMDDRLPLFVAVTKEMYDRVSEE